MRPLIIFSIFVLFSTSLINAQNKEEKVVIIRSVLSNLNKMETFYKKGLSDSIENMYSPNANSIRGGQARFDGRDDIIKKVVSDLRSDKKISNFDYESEDQKVYNDIVLDIGILKITYLDPQTKGQQIKTYNYMNIWKKSTDGKYRIRSDSWTLIK